jgi:hypothetical protein
MRQEVNELAELEARRDAAIRLAERSAFEYFHACHSDERARAAALHEGLYCTMLAAGLFSTQLDNGARL